MKKKIVSLLLVAAMTVSLVACGGKGQQASNTEAGTEAAGTEVAEEYKLEKITCVVNGTLTATVDSGQQEFEKQWEDAVGVDLVIKQLDHSSYNEQVGTLFVSGDYPDVMIMSADMYAQYAPTGILWDMTEAYENAEFQSRITSPETNEFLKKDGRLYGFAPAYGNGCVTYVKTAWLEKCGIDPSTITTYDAYIDMLTKFKTMDPDGNGKDDTYGVIAAGFLGSEAPFINYLPEFWQDAYPAIYKKDGTWIDGFNTPETKAALVRLQEAYEAGLIDPTTLTNGTKDAREKWFSNDQSGSSGVFTYWAGTWNNNLVKNLAAKGLDSELIAINPIKELGKYTERLSPVWAITKKAQNPEGIFKYFIDTMLDGGDVQLAWEAGAKGTHWDDKAESVTVKGKEDKPTEYKEGQFHFLPSPEKPNTLMTKNHIDPILCLGKFKDGTTGPVSITDIAKKNGEWFAKNCESAVAVPMTEALSDNLNDVNKARNEVVAKVALGEWTVDQGMDYYNQQVSTYVKEILDSLNK